MSVSADSCVATSADIAEDATIVRSHVGEHCMVGSRVRLCYSHLGNYSYLSVNSNCFSSTIGQFSSISWNVSIGPACHDYTRVSTHAMMYAARFGMLGEGGRFYNQYEGEVLIGNDVWIGCNAVVMRGVTIGDGAAIGANSIVTRDVPPPYSIVVGVDRVIKTRFAPEVVEALMELKWWTAPSHLIKEHMDLLSRVPDMKTIERLKASLFPHAAERSC